MLYLLATARDDTPSRVAAAAGARRRHGPEHIHRGYTNSHCRREHLLGEQSLLELNPLFLRFARSVGFYSDRLLQDLLARESIAGMDYLPPIANELFRTALEIGPQVYLRIQSAFQRHTDNAISKAINVSHAASVDDIASACRQAWELGLKGITVFRYGSKK